MRLQECLNRLARGKLSNLAICSNGTIKPEKVDRVVDAINEALIRLYTDFPIKENSVFVELTESRSDYPLTSEHSFRNATNDIYASYNYYIRDTEEHPFEDDIIQILEVWDDLDRKRPINDPEDILSIGVNETNIISVQVPLDYRALNVIYRAKHTPLSSTKLSDQIELPSNLEGALMSYVAYLVHQDLNTETAVTNAQKYYQEYQMITNGVNQNAPINLDKLVMDSKFNNRGWV